MKLNQDFIYRRVVDSALLVPCGNKRANFNGILSLNKVGAFVAEKLQEETTFESLVESVVNKFEVDAQTATRDIETFLDQLRANGALDE